VFETGLRNIQDGAVFTWWTYGSVFFNHNREQRRNILEPNDNDAFTS